MSTTQSVQLNIRIPEAIASDLDTLADYEHLSRPELTRQILLNGIAHRRRTLALRLYREGEVSKSRAAEIAGISLWEMMDLIEQAALPNTYTLQEAIEDIRKLVTQVVTPQAE